MICSLQFNPLTIGDFLLICFSESFSILSALRSSDQWSISFQGHEGQHFSRFVVFCVGSSVIVPAGRRQAICGVVCQRNSHEKQHLPEILAQIAFIYRVWGN